MSYLSSHKTPLDTTKILQFAKREAGAISPKLEWIRTLVGHRQRILDYKGGAGVIAGLVMWAFRRWYLLSKLPLKIKQDMKRKRIQMYKTWTQSYLFVKYCGVPSCRLVCKAGVARGESGGRKHVRYPDMLGCSQCITVTARKGVKWA